jgi:hypothetical protein
MLFAYTKWQHKHVYYMVEKVMQRQHNTDFLSLIFNVSQISMWFYNLRSPNN